MTLHITDKAREPVTLAEGEPVDVAKYFSQGLVLHFVGQSEPEGIEREDLDAKLTRFSVVKNYKPRSQWSAEERAACNAAFEHVAAVLPGHFKTEPMDGLPGHITLVVIREVAIVQH